MPGPALRIGFVGRYAKFKGLHLLVQWFEAARAAGIPAVLKLRGRTASEDVAYWAGLRQAIGRSPFAAEIIDEGWVERERLYADLDLVVVPSDFPDPLPFVVPEAQTAGLPVLAYPAGGIKEMIRDGETGFLVHDARSFVAVLHRLVANPSLYQAVQREAFAAARREMGMGRFHAEIGDLYGDLAGAPARAGRARIARAFRPAP